MCSVIPHVFLFYLFIYLFLNLNILGDVYYVLVYVLLSVDIASSFVCVELQQASVFFFQLVLVSNTVFYNYVLYKCMYFLFSFVYDFSTVMCTLWTAYR